jgi:hypothetical protein
MGQILLRNGNLLDAAAGETRPGHPVLVEGDRTLFANRLAT